MNNIVDFPSRNQEVRFRVHTVNLEIFNGRRNEPIYKKHAVIVLTNVKNDRYVVHPLTYFIFKYWKGKEYNSMLSVAKVVTNFLNFILIDNKDKYNIKSLSDITFTHGSLFLNYLTQKGNKKTTIKQYEGILTKFYYYLATKGLLDNIDRESFNSYDFNGSKVNKSPFEGVLYNNHTTNVIHEIKPELILVFLETAYELTPCIALGVYYQIFGGLRSGEVVNIRKRDISNIGPNGIHGQVVNLKENNLRKDLKNSSGLGHVKFDRKQVIFPYKNLLNKLYITHLEQFQALDKSEALFVNPLNGKAMTGANYHYHYGKLKKLFIERLTSHENTAFQTYGHYLQNVKWKTHIGRGIFSNMIANYTNNALEVAVARGDSNLASSLTYISNTEQMVEKIQIELENLYSSSLLD